jgi:uncharacterized protein (DUF362 family)/Pyruvate/2-oxoacid:ferredoxin oxidoreductase delta subunit
MTRVICKNGSYDYQTLKPTIFDMLTDLGGNLINRQTSVLIKPNLLMPAKPEYCILTHPFVVKAVAEYVLDKGGHPLIADSPAMGSFKKIKKDGGYSEALEDLDVDIKAFDTTVALDIGRPFGKIEVAREAVESDVIINLPKLKTHTGMLLSLGVKNLFGCIVGLKKPEWHLKSGVDREMFARLLVQIYHTINPSITLVDGIQALQGQGPGKSGVPRHLGILVGGRDAFAVDMAICSMLGIKPDELPTLEAAKKLGMLDTEVEFEGEFNAVGDFRVPMLAPLTFGPKPVHKFMRKHLLQRPEADDLLCQLCGECWQYCPAKAITPNKEQIDFDFDVCIRCYCCIEICPHGALHTTETLPGKIMRKLSILK